MTQQLAPTQNLRGLLTAMANQTAHVKQLEAELKLAKDELEAIKDQLLVALDSQETDSTSSPGIGKAKITESIVPQVENWDEFYKYVLRKKAVHLIERRPSVTGCRELWDQNSTIPGVAKFTKRTVKFQPE